MESDQEERHTKVLETHPILDVPHLSIHQWQVEDGCSGLQNIPNHLQQQQKCVYTAPQGVHKCGTKNKIYIHTVRTYVLYVCTVCTYITLRRQCVYTYVRTCLGFIFLRILGGSTSSGCKVSCNDKEQYV